MVIHIHIGADDGVAGAALLMRFHYLRFQRIVFRLGKGGDHLHLRECLKSELTHKAWQTGIQYFEGLNAIPYTPVMTVAPAPGFGSAPVGRIRRTMQIEAVGIQLLHLVGQQRAEQLVVSRKHTLVYLFTEFLIPAPVFDCLNDFIVSAPHGNAGMIA